MHSPMLMPPPLKNGDLIAIVAPASVVKRESVESGKAFLEACGFRVVIAPHTLGPASGSYAASDEARADDLLTVLQDPAVRAVFCARGGYGCVHLIPRIPPELVRRDPKWLIGFSDVSALHAFWHTCGVASVHGPMVKYISEHALFDLCTQSLLMLLRGAPLTTILTAPHPLSRHGDVHGMLLGGNLAVLDGLAGTPFDLLHVGKNEDVILFIEDIAEPIYKVERMLVRLRLSGTLNHIRGLIIGEFTDYKPDSNFQSVEEMIASRLEEWGISDIPVAFGFPTGHGEVNYPLLEGASASLTVGVSGTRLDFSYVDPTIAQN